MPKLSLRPSTGSVGSTIKGQISSFGAGEKLSGVLLADSAYTVNGRNYYSR